MYYIGIDLGGTNIAVGVVTAEGQVVKKTSVPTRAERPFDEIFADMAESADFHQKNLLIENWRNFNGSNMDRRPEEGH